MNDKWGELKGKVYEVGHINQGNRKRIRKTEGDQMKKK